MARIQAGTRLEITYAVGASLGRTYGFDWAVGDGGDVSVDLKGSPVPRSAYEVELAVGGAGGQVRFFTPGEYSGAVTLAEGDEVRVFRDTEARERAAFAPNGYATSNAVRVMAGHVHRVLEELASRLETHGRIILGNDEVNALITTALAAGVKAYALAQGREIALGDTDFGGTVEQSLDRNRCRYDSATHSVILVSNDGTELRLALPEAGAANAGLPAHTAADAGQVLTVEADGLTTSWDPVTGAKVVIDASGFTGNLETTDTSAQKVAERLDGLDLGGDLDQDAVDARVNALVPSWARQTQRFTDEQREVFNAFTGDAWRDSTTIKVATTFSTTATPSNPENFTFQTRVVTGPRYTNVFALIEVPTSETGAGGRERRRLRVGELPPVVLADATTVEEAGGNTYYTVPLADVPASTNIYVEVLTPFELDPNRVAGLPEPWAQRGSTLPVPNDRIRLPHTTEFTRVSPGLTTTNSSASKYTSIVGVSPIFDLDVPANQRGLFVISGKVTAALAGSATDVNFGFEGGKANQTAEDRTKSVSALVRASELLASTRWSGTAGGISLLRAPVYSLSTLLGYWRLTLVRDGTNRVGVVGWYEAGGGNANNYVFSSAIDIEFIPNDAPQVASGRSFLVAASPTSNVDVTTVEQTADVNAGRLAGWISPWTQVIALPAMQAHQQGRVNVQAHIYGRRTTAPVDNGDRVSLFSRLVRSRPGQRDHVMLDQADYGPRGLYTGGSALYLAATLEFSEELVKSDLAQTGDVYKVMVQLVQQKPTGARTIRFDTNPRANFMEVIPIGP